MVERLGAVTRKGLQAAAAYFDKPYFLPEYKTLIVSGPSPGLPCEEGRGLASGLAVRGLWAGELRADVAGDGRAAAVGHGPRQKRHPRGWQQLCPAQQGESVKVYQAIHTWLGNLVGVSDWALVELQEGLVDHLTAILTATSGADLDADRTYQAQ